MTQEETLDRILVEIRTKCIQATPEYVPTSDHYFPLRFLEYYLKIIYAIGFDEGRRQNSHGKPVAQIENEEIIKIWPTQYAAEKFYKLSKGAIGKSFKGKTKKGECIKIAGFEWKQI